METATFDMQLRKDFPILNNSAVVYFDNAASTQKPSVVLEAMDHYYRTTHANVHRGVHKLSQQATDKFESARRSVQCFINAREDAEVIFTKGTTESVNLVAHGFSTLLNEGDEVLISGMEHHSNIVPWQMACERSGAKLKVVPVLDDGSLDIGSFHEMLTDKVRIISIVHVSNALGTINPVKEIVSAAHAKGIPVMLDGAQATPHFQVDVQELDCDFYAFSGHKVFGPTGIGVLYGKRQWLEKLPPYQGGGEMIDRVTFEKTTYNTIPFKFEAGTPAIAEAIGLGAAVEYMQQIDMQDASRHEEELRMEATKIVESIAGARIFGTTDEKCGVVSFLIDGIHPYDLGTLLDQQDIAVRTGHHCTQPLMDRFEIPGTVRASFAFYNTHEELDKFDKALNRAVNMLRA